MVGPKVTERQERAHRDTLPTVSVRALAILLLRTRTHIPQNRPYPCAPCPTRTRTPNRAARDAQTEVTAEATRDAARAEPAAEEEEEDGDEGDEEAEGE